MKLENYKFIQRYFLIALFSSVTYCLSAQITSYPYTMGFESGEMVDWGALANDFNCTTEWLNTEFSEDATSGASAANNGAQYISARFNGCLATEYVKTITGPEFDLSAITAPEIVFYTHIFGSDEGILNLELSTDGGSNWNVVLWSVDTQTDPQQSSGTAPWTSQTVDLTAYVGQTVQLRFVATAVDPVIAFSLDDITLRSASNMVNGSGDVTYSYDEAGNRTARTLVVNLLDPSEQNIIAATRSMEKDDVEDPRVDLYKIYPNPTSNYVNIEAMQDVGVVDVTVLDMMGRQLARSSMTNSSHRIDMTNYEPGSYVLWIQYEDTVVTRKILKY